MRKSIHVFLLAAFSVLALPATQLIAGVVPPVGLVPGQQYQLVFATTDTIAATSLTEAPYNTFVNTEAGLSPSLPLASWSSVTSTADGTNANANAPSGGLPIYNTAGQLVATAGTGLYTAPLLTPIGYDQYGSPVTGPGSYAWTGSLEPSGSGFPTRLLGLASPEYGIATLTSGWMEITQGPNNVGLAVYALSSPITFPGVPEPAALTLMGTALLLIGGVRFLRRQRR